MATADTVDLSESHAPKEESINVFRQIEHELKKTLVHLRHEHTKHEPEYFAAVKHLSDAQLAGFGPDDLQEVRVAVSAYGVHLFGKVRIPAMPDDGPAYIHFRAFTGGPDDQASLHSIHTEDKEEPDGGHTFRAIFTKNDSLEWFDT
ncbi:SnoaL-like domain-containing protein [Madurella fahalii]|uniref:SnoaL-like domain-containing protein n=1 Tax=Madurella fahalii TaxID=1157608 RepID=A0ABQ0G0I6_9PEZI